jgi:peptidoglycan/LPS O-acetylase OafA/YrhL
MAQAPPTHFLILRIALASVVLLVHFSVITGTRPVPWLSGLSSTVAVQAFFVISGWLVSESCARSATCSRFWLRRSARLYPLYLCVVVTQAAVAYALARPSAASGELLRYLGANLAFLNFLQPSLFGLLSDAPVQAINPSLWTLKLEVMFYAITPLLVLFVRAQRALGTVALLLGALALYYLSLWHSPALARHFPGQLRFFAAGIVCWQVSARVPQHRGWLALAGVAALAVAHVIVDMPWLGGVQPLLLGTFVFAAARVLPEPRHLPDVSYGIYLWHAPLIQLSLLLGMKPDLGLTCMLTLLLATLSWYALEKPAIAWAKGSTRQHRGKLQISPSPRLPVISSSNSRHPAD